MEIASGEILDFIRRESEKLPPSRIPMPPTGRISFPKVPVGVDYWIPKGENVVTVQLANVAPGSKILELGGGDNPHPQATCNVDVRPGPKTHFTADFNEPLPIASDEWDGVICQFCIEHLSWRKVRQFVAEIHRVLKPGGKAIVITANTEAQVKWIEANPGGWDGKDAFDSFSCVLFGDQDYPENAHRCWMSPKLAFDLFGAAGFEAVVVHPFGDRKTDICIEARKGVSQSVVLTPVAEARTVNPTSGQPAESLFDKHYFNGGGKVGGYFADRWGSYRDFPCHEVTARHVLARKPESVLELGCARGYVMKRLQDAGVYAAGLEVSKHCYLTRVAHGIASYNLCDVPWYRGAAGIVADLCFSIATLEHVPEAHLPAVIAEMKRTCKRGLHGIDFGGKDDGRDKTHCTLRPFAWWVDQFERHAPGWPVEIADKEQLESGPFPPEVQKGDGKVKLNVGSFTTMHHHGWLNIDQHDLKEYAAENRYNFLQRDVRQGLPFQTGAVDLIHACHSLEHLTYEEGLAFLRECRRVIKQEGAMRIIVPDAAKLIGMYAGEEVYGLGELDEINDGCAAVSTSAAKLWAMLHAGHAAAYDAQTLSAILAKAGFRAVIASFRHTEVDPVEQILRETLDMLPCLSLYVDAVPIFEG